jgi:hypothetical protein
LLRAASDPRRSGNAGSLPSVYLAGQSHPPCLDFNRQMAQRHPLLRFRARH